MIHSPTAMQGLFDAEFFDIESQTIGDTFRIFIGKPALIAPDSSHPVIFALDGNAAFSSLLGTQRMLTQGSEVPPSFVVGIGYPGDTLAAAMSNRNRDYAPTEPGEYEAKSLGALMPAGGPAFRDFIQKELKPHLASHYPIDMADSTLQGISMGGLFATWILLTTPSDYQRYVVGSPALWWRDEQVWEWEQQYAEANNELSATVFLGAGGFEAGNYVRAEAVAIASKNPHMREFIQGVIDFNDEHGWPEIAKLTAQLAERLEARGYSKLKVQSQILPDENHMSAPPALCSRGLRYVNGSWPAT